MIVDWKINRQLKNNTNTNDLVERVLVLKKCVTAVKVKFSINDFFSKCDQIAVYCGFGHIYWGNP